MKKILVIDACVRGAGSRTAKLMQQAVDTLQKVHPDWKFERLELGTMNLSYWTAESLEKRDELLQKRVYDAPVFALGHQFREADGLIVAAPFWDLSIPAVLKVYIENVSAEGITFGCGPQGLYGLCRADWMLFLTTRGGVYGDNDQEQGNRYMKAMAGFFGVKRYECVAAEGLDDVSLDREKIFSDALLQVQALCRSLK